MLSYEPNSYGVWYKLGDGVTTNLGMHGIKTPVDASQFFSSYTGANTPPLHYGGAFSDQWYRDSVGIKSTASASQISRLEDDLNAQLDEGFIGLAVDPEYAPYITYDEYAGLGAAAQRAGVPLFTHIRYSSPTPGASSLDAIDEVLKVARETGVSLHVDHIPSMATHVMPEAIAKMEAARAEGLDVTGCFYPYTFWGTYLASARFNGDWQTRFRISYEDLQLAGSSERLTAASFKKYQAQNKLVVAYAIPQADVDAAVKAPWTMIGSDAIPESSNNNHPRGAGCFARLLGPYARDMGTLLADGRAGQVHDHPGHAGREPGADDGEEGPHADGRRRRHHGVRPRHRRRHLHRREAGPVLRRHRHRAGDGQGRQGRRRREEGRAQRPGDHRRARLTHFPDTGRGPPVACAP